MSRFSQHGTLRRVLKCQVNYDKLWDQAPNKKESFITSHTEIHVVLHSQWFFCFVSPMLLTSPHISSPREMKKKRVEPQNLSTLFGSIFYGGSEKRFCTINKPGHHFRGTNRKSQNRRPSVCCSPTSWVFRGRKWRRGRENQDAMGRWDGGQSMAAVVHTQRLRDMKSYEKVVVELTHLKNMRKSNWIIFTNFTVNMKNIQKPPGN